MSLCCNLKLINKLQFLYEKLKWLGIFETLGLIVTNINHNVLIILLIIKNEYFSFFISKIKI